MKTIITAEELSRLLLNLYPSGFCICTCGSDTGQESNYVCVIVFHQHVFILYLSTEQQRSPVLAAGTDLLFLKLNLIQVCDYPSIFMHRQKKPKTVLDLMSHTPPILHLLSGNIVFKSNNGWRIYYKMETGNVRRWELVNVALV